MNQETKDASIEILGKTYQIKCPEADISALKAAAKFLEEKMQALREAGVFSLDRIAVVTALNVVHQLQTLEQQKLTQLQTLTQHIHQLQHKIDTALAAPFHRDLQSVE